MANAEHEFQLATVRHILVASKPQAKEVLEVLSQSKRPLKAFKKMAKEYSKCPSGKKGGLLDEFSKGQMVKEFEEAVLACDLESVPSEFVRTKFGFHIIWVHDIKY
jgi:peptidyl-prolyl cis-trans isomerase C